MRKWENKTLRRIFGPKREKGVRGWRKLHNEELHNLKASPNIVRKIKFRRIRCAGHVLDEKCTQHFGWKTSREQVT
jgi:hypothetical protein